MLTLGQSLHALLSDPLQAGGAADAGLLCLASPHYPVGHITLLTLCYPALQTCLQS